MKVLYIIPHTFISGAAIQLQALLQNLSPDIEKTVMVTSYNGILENRFRRLSRLISLQGKTEDEKHDILKRYLINDFDILHVIESWDGYRLLPHFHKKKIVTLYGDYKRTDPYFKKRISELRDQGPDKPIIVTDNPRNLDLSLPGIHYIKTGVHAPDPEYHPERKPENVIWVGRNSDEKRFSTLIKIAEALPELTFTAVVSGLSPTQELPLNLKLYNNIIHPVELEYLYKRSSIYLNTSKHEGTPQALIEAMSCGCIPVCPNTGGIPDLIGNNGLVVPTSSRDKDERVNVKLFVKAITSYMDYIPPGLRERIINRVKYYTIPNMIKDWEVIYNE